MNEAGMAGTSGRWLKRKKLESESDFKFRKRQTNPSPDDDEDPEPDPDRPKFPPCCRAVANKVIIHGSAGASTSTRQDPHLSGVVELETMGTLTQPKALNIRNVTSIVLLPTFSQEQATLPTQVSTLLERVLGALHYDEGAEAWTSSYKKKEGEFEGFDECLIKDVIDGFREGLENSAGRTGLTSLFKILLKCHLKNFRVYNVGGSSKASKFAVCCLFFMHYKFAVRESSSSREPDSQELDEPQDQPVLSSGGRSQDSPERKCSPSVNSYCRTQVPDVVVTLDDPPLPKLVISIKSGKLYERDRLQLLTEMLYTLLKQESTRGLLIGPHGAIIMDLIKTGQDVVLRQTTFPFSKRGALRDICLRCAGYCYSQLPPKNT